jgi:hypothetical protein
LEGKELEMGCCTSYEYDDEDTSVTFEAHMRYSDEKSIAEPLYTQRDSTLWEEIPPLEGTAETDEIKLEPEAHLGSSDEDEGNFSRSGKF